MLNDYAPFCSEKELSYIQKLASRMQGLTVNSVSASSYGNGPAQTLERLMPVAGSLGLNARCINLSMPKEFLDVSKQIAAGIRDAAAEVPKESIDKFLSYSSLVKEQADKPCDLLFVNDPPPITLIESKNYKKAIWCCHADASHPDLMLWRFLKSFIELYDAAAFSFPSFSGGLSVPVYALMPSIDPLSDKNKPLEPQYIQSVFDKYKIPRGKPIIMQVGRFNNLKDPLGVIDVYEEVRKEHDCVLVLAGGQDANDTSAHNVHAKVLERAAKTDGVYALSLEQNDLEINALQRGADIIVQKSIRENFAVAITEALWKKKPVVATETGAVHLQIIEGQTGLLSVSNKSCASQIKKLLRDPRLCAELGEGGHKLVKENFLITRHLRDLLIVLCHVMGCGE